jgi:hypothetical protein
VNTSGPKIVTTLTLDCGPGCAQTPGKRFFEPLGAFVTAGTPDAFHSVQGETVMANAIAPELQNPQEALSGERTLLELVQSIGEITSNDEEVVATVIYMLRSGRVRLCGNFRDERIDLICPPSTPR